MKQKHIEKIYWEDAHGVAETQAPEDMDGKLAPVVTVGFLIKETKKSVVIAAEYFPDCDEYRDTTTIPKSCVTKRITLKE